MEKLIELLNEFDKPLGWYYEDGVLDCKLNLYEYMAYEWICSARYGFIKWLVENDKIDFEGMSGHGKIISYLTDEKDYKRNDIKEGVVLMLLSISNSPIEDLISYLK